MGILQNIKNHLPILRTTSDTKYITQLENRLHPIREYNNLQLYYRAMQNPVVYKCNKVYKNTALSCNFTIDTDTQEKDDINTKEYLNHLFLQPEGYSNNTTWADLNSLIWDSKDNLGDCFLEVSTDKDYNILNGFKYIHNDQISWNTANECYQLTENPSVQYEPQELIHIREPNIELTEYPWGVSKINRCSEYIALFENALQFNNFMLNNDGLDPNTFIIYDKDMDNTSFKNEVTRLQQLRQLQKQHGKPGGLIAMKGATVQKATSNNKDMQYLELLKFARDGIIQTYGVPPQLAGIIETANLGSGSGDSQKKDWKLTFEGEAVFIENAFNNCLKQYGFNERFHFSKMDIIDELYDAQVNQILVSMGIKTREEVRNDMGLDKMDNTLTWADYYS